MNSWGLIPADVTTATALALCAVAFVSGTARGFSGFGAALIFMPLASSLAAPRLVAALLLVIDFVSAAPLVPNAFRHADRKATAVMVAGALVGVPIGTWFLRPARSRHHPLDHLPVSSPPCWRCCCQAGAIAARSHAAISVGVGGVLRILQRPGPDRRPSDRRLLARPAARSSDRPRQYPVVLRRLGLLFPGELWRDRIDHARIDPLLAAGRPDLWHRGRLRRIAVRPRQRAGCSARSAMA